MSISCPHCQTRVPLRIAYAVGEVFTVARGIPMRGQVDSSGVVHAAEKGLNVDIDLKVKDTKFSSVRSAKKNSSVKRNSSHMTVQFGHSRMRPQRRRFQARSENLSLKP